MNIPDYRCLVITPEQAAALLKKGIHNDEYCRRGTLYGMPVFISDAFGDIPVLINKPSYPWESYLDEMVKIEIDPSLEDEHEGEVIDQIKVLPKRLSEPTVHGLNPLRQYIKEAERQVEKSITGVYPREYIPKHPIIQDILDILYKIKRLCVKYKAWLEGRRKWRP